LPRPLESLLVRLASTDIGHEMIAAGMLIMAGGGNGTPLELERWTRVGYERGMRSSKDER
jgi:hypothetical protein